ncbi:hypothetical protein DEO72_LG5g2025 [Vigna unguiculata]|uniref:Uncharacterized protein n=1 Tax=Vigna unguiculata TaxID=3917 RepID=A0A4D6M037_VIGUN|nr:hypothetical protein DEO72_LG5g2025 [Vigna unguiculata]
MAVVGPSSKEVFLELRRKKLEEEKRKGGESAGRAPAEMPSQKSDLMPPIVENKKSKRRDRTARSSTPRLSSPKKSRGTSSADSATDSLAAMFDAQLKINQGIEVSLSSEEAEIVSAMRLETVLYALNEFHAREMMMGHHLNTVLSQLPETSKLAAEIESLQRELAEANNRRQEVSLQLGSLKNERSQLLAERNVFKARCRDFEKKDEDSQAALERLEEELAAEKRESAEKAGRIYRLEEYKMSQHDGGFHKALR